MILKNYRQDYRYQTLKENYRKIIVIEKFDLSPTPDPKLFGCQIYAMCSFFLAKFIFHHSHCNILPNVVNESAQLGQKGKKSILTGEWVLRNPAPKASTKSCDHGTTNQKSPNYCTVRGKSKV